VGLEELLATWMMRVWNGSLDEGRAALRERMHPDCLLEGIGGEVPPLHGPEEHLPTR